MPDKAHEQAVINAPVDAVFDALVDFERYPEWAGDLKQATIVEHDEEGRAKVVEFRAAAMGRSTTYRLRYDYDGAPGRLAWVLESGDLDRELDGAYHLREADDAGSTEVVYELSVDLVLPIPGFVKRRAEARIIKTTLADLKALIESGTRALSAGRPPMRTLLFTGKGGVGKTTVAAATAVRCAAAGRRTLIISTDPAHSLADAFDIPLETEPREIAEGLWGQQLDAQDRMEESWGEIKDFLTDVFDWAGLDAVEAEELSVLPGLDEVFTLTDIKTYADSGDWDVLVVDCAPTAETIRLLSLPDILAWYMDRVFPIGRRVNRIVGPVLSRLSSMPVAGDDVFRSTSRFYERLDGVKAILADPEHSSIRLVVNPEKMVIAEARRTYTYLSLFGYRVDAVVANRLLPDDIADPWFDRWKQAQAEQMVVIEEGFAPLPILRSELRPTEPIGLERLAELAAALYADVEPTEVLHHGEPLRITKDDDGYELSLELPFADHDDLDVGRHGDELLVRIGPYRRAIALPDSLRRRTVVGARFRDGVLRVAFDADRSREAPRARGERR